MRNPSCFASVVFSLIAFQAHGQGEKRQLSTLHRLTSKRGPETVYLSRPPVGLESRTDASTYPPKPILGGRRICNGLVGIWNHDINMAMSGNPDVAVSLYVNSMCGCDPVIATLVSAGVLNHEYNYGYNSATQRYELNDMLYAKQKYVNDGGAWCEFWDAGDSAYLYDDNEETPVGYLIVLTSRQVARLNSTNPIADEIFQEEALLKTWGAAFDDFLIENRALGNLNRHVIGRRSKGCYIMIRLNEQSRFFMTTDLYRFMDGAIWGVPYEEWPFRIAYHDSSTNFFKHLRYDTDTGLFKRASPLTEAYLRPVDGGRSTRHNFKGDRFEGHEIFLDKSPCAVDLDGDHMELILRINEGVADFLILAGQAMLMTDYVAQRMHS